MNGRAKRLLAWGPACSDAELLAIFLRVGMGQERCRSRRELITRFGSLNRLFGASLAGLRRYPAWAKPSMRSRPCSRWRNKTGRQLAARGALLATGRARLPAPDAGRPESMRSSSCSGSMRRTG